MATPGDGSRGGARGDLMITQDGPPTQTSAWVALFNKDNMPDKILHLVVRFSDTMFGVGNVVARHNEVIETQGAVWFGKLGQTISQTRVDALNNQIEKGIPTFLYLVKGNRKKSTAYRTTLLQVSKEKPEDTTSIPAYYVEKDLLKYMKAWMKIGQIDSIDMVEMDGLRAISSVYPITETLAKSSSGYFLVRKSNKSYFGE